MRDYILDSAVCLHRNFLDLPFDASEHEETAHRVNDRVSGALEQCGDSFSYLPIASLQEDKRTALQQRRLLSADAGDASFSVAYLRMDEKLCVEAAGEDHLIIAAYDEGEALNSCLLRCKDTMRYMEDAGKLAWDERLGYLTARPCDVGTAMRASVLLHLPMTALVKQIPAAMKVAAACGMSLRSVAQGFCVLENRITLGQDEETLLSKLAEAAKKLCTLERSLRWRAKERKDIAVADKAWRAYAIGRFALRVGINEALQLWSGLTLGLSSMEMPYREETLDRLWQAILVSQEDLSKESNLHPDIERARRIRALLNHGGD